MLYLMLGDKTEHFENIKEIEYKKYGSIDKLQQSLNQRMLFSTIKTYVCDRVDLKLVDMDILKATDKDVILMLTEIDKRSALYKYAKKSNSIVTSEGNNIEEVLKQAGLQDKTWLRAHLQQSGTPLLKVRLIVDQLTNLKPLTNEGIKYVLGTEIQDEIFKCIDSIFLGQPHQFVTLFNNLIYLKESEFKILILLSNKLNTLLRIYAFRTMKLKDIMEETKLSYYQVKNNLPIAQHLQLIHLLHWYREALRIEQGIKEGTEDLKLCVENLMLSIVKETTKWD